MMDEFIVMVKELFPSISPYTAETARNAMRQFEQSGAAYNCFTPTPFKDFLAQGDIISNLPFTRYAPDGEQMELRTCGLMLSNTCGAENGDVVTFSPLWALDSLDLPRRQVELNRKYRFMYFPDSRMSNFVVDFGIITAFPKRLVQTGISNGFLEKKHSLSQFGYYLFLCKLTVWFMRPEDTVIQLDRA